jgi:hypothetical protein
MLRLSKLTGPDGHRHGSRQKKHAGVHMAFPNNKPTLAAMGKTTYGLTWQKDGRISVEITKPNGCRRIVPDFRDAAEAYAWIIQMQRLTDAANPHLPGRAAG